MLKNERLIIRCLTALPFGLLFVAFTFNHGCAYVENGLLLVFGGMSSAELPSLFQIVLQGVLTFPPLIIFGAMLPRDLNRAAVFIFPRATSRMYWYVKKLSVVVLGALGYYLTLLFTYVGILRFIGIPALNVKTLSWTIISIVAAAILNHVVFIVIANIISLRISQNYALLLLWVVSFPGQIIVNNVLNITWLQVFYPSSQAVLSLHDIPVLKATQENYFESSIPHFTVGVSTIYNLLLFTAFVLIGARMVRVKNLTV